MGNWLGNWVSKDQSSQTPMLVLSEEMKAAIIKLVREHFRPAESQLVCNINTEGINKGMEKLGMYLAFGLGGFIFASTCVYVLSRTTGRPHGDE